VGLDPELVLFGIHSQMGPIFSRNVFFRPNADFEWGEVTDMVALNLEAVYRIPNATRGGTWSPYLGDGPSLNFIHQGFKTQAGESRDISFSNFNYENRFQHPRWLRESSRHIFRGQGRPVFAARPGCAADCGPPLLMSASVAELLT